MSVAILGSINMDVVLNVARLPKPGETISSATIAQHPGGKGANQAVAAARLGAQTMLIGAVGQDDLGKKLVANLKSAGVGTAHITDVAHRPTGQAYITVSRDGENSIVVVPGANQGIAPGMVASPALEEAGVFLAQLEVPVVTVQAFFTTEAARNGVRLLNAAPFVQGAKSLLELVDGIIVNETELAQHAGADSVPEELEEIALLAQKLIGESDRFVVVTLGKRGALAVTPNSYKDYPGIDVKAVDTTGAGDCFCGALAAAIDKGLGLNAAMQFANAAAALSTTRAGAGSSMPALSEVEAKVEELAKAEESATAG